MKLFYKNISLLITCFFVCIHAQAANYYWVGGSGNWSDINHWATTSGGSTFQSFVPSPNDDVFFDTGSGFTASSKIVTINTNATCRNMTWSGTLNNPTITGSISFIPAIAGSLILQNGITYSVPKTSFVSSLPGQTITTNGVVIKGAFFFNGTGEYILQDNLTTQSSNRTDGIGFNNGTLNTNSVTINAGWFGEGEMAISPSRTLTLGSSQLFLSNNDYSYGNAVAFEYKGNVLNAGSSHIHITGSGAYTNFFDSKTGLSYYDISFTNPLSVAANFLEKTTSGGVTVRNLTMEGSGIIGGNNQFTNVTLNGKRYAFLSSSTQTITGIFTATTSSCSNGITEISAREPGIQTNFYFPAGSSAAIANVMLTGINATGAILPVTATNSIDNGNNTNITIIAPAARVLHWVGGSGNWNDPSHWSLLQSGPGGECVPTPNDDVFFDAGSGFTAGSAVVTATDVSQYCKNMTWSGAAASPTLQGAYSSKSSLNIFGSVTLQTAMSYKASDTWMRSNVPGNTITSNACTIGTDMYFCGSGGWIFQDDFNSLNKIFLFKGDLNTNGKTITIFTFESSVNVGYLKPSVYTRTLSLGSSSITVTGGNWNYAAYYSAGVLNAGTSHINLSGTLNTFTARDADIYYDITFSNPNATNSTISAYLNLTAHDVTFLSNGTLDMKGTYNSLVFSANKKYVINNGYQQNIITSFSSNAASCTGLIDISASPIATFSFAPGAIATINNTVIQGMNAVGAVPLNATNSVDLGNNSGITFASPTGTNLYWIGGTGNWNDGAHWSFTSGGVAAFCVPGPGDNVFFNNSSGLSPGNTKKVTLNGSAHYCNSMDWTVTTGTPSIVSSSDNSLNIFGSLTLQAAMQFNPSNVYFRSSNMGNTITSNGNVMLNVTTASFPGFYFTGTGDWTLTDNLSMSRRSIFLYSGHLNTNNKNVTIGAFFGGATWFDGRSCSSAISKTLTIGSSQIKVGTTGGYWFYRGANNILNALPNSSIEFPQGGTLLTNPSHTYGNVSFLSTLGGVTSFINNLSTPCGDGTRFNKLTLTHNTELYSGLQTDTLILSAGGIYKFEAGKTQTVTSAFYPSGNPCFITFMQSLTSGSRANINVQSGNVNYDFVNVKDMDATSSYTALQFAGHSTDVGNNLNMTFAPTTTVGIGGLGPDQVIACNGFPITLNTANFYPNPNTVFTWYNANTSNSVTVADSGRYFISVNYGASCVIKDTIKLSKPAALPVTATASNTTICNGSSTILSASGATSYAWSTGATTASISINPSASTIYSVTGTDVNSCTNTKTLSITVNPTPVVGIASISSNSFCPGNSSVITPSGLSSYTLQPGNMTGSSFTVSPSSTTTYTINGTSAAGCISTSASEAHSTIVVNPTPIIGIASVSSNSICSGNNTVITPNGASTYTLTPGGLTGTSFTVSPLVSTTYTISGTSAAGCINTAASVATTTITINPTPTIGIASVSSNSICSGNNSVITPNGALSYTLMPGNVTGTSFTVSPSSTTTYTINGISAAGCLSNASSAAATTIIVNPTPTIGITSVSNSTLCSGNTSVITPNGALSYTLMPGNVVGTSFTVSPLATTVYTINGTSASGCISNAASAATTTIIVNPTPTIGITSVSNNTVCSGNNSVITPNGANTYTLMPGNIAGTSFTVNPLATTVYTINGTSASGCISNAASAATTTITVNPTPTIGITSVSSNSICSGNNSVITPNGASTYTLMPGNIAGTSFTVSPASNTTYTINGTNATGCISNTSSAATATITVNPTPTIGLAFVSSNTVCPGNSSVIIPNGASTYTLMPGNVVGTSFTVTPLAITIYTITGTSTFGCSSTNSTIATTTVAVNSNPSIGISSVSSASLCPGNSSVITPNGGSTYTLTPGNISGTSFTVTPLGTTVYTISGSSAAGCISSTATPVSTTITINQTPTISIASVSNATICSGNASVITPNGAATYTLMPGAMAGTSFTVSPLVTTTYTISGTNASGCSSIPSSEVISTITVNQTPTINIASVSNATLCAGNTSIITPGGASTYTLMPGNSAGTSFTVMPSVTTTYTINGTNASGCSSNHASEITTTITVNTTPTISIASVSNSTLCAGGNAIITPNGASTYTLMPGNLTGSSFTVAPLSTTVYTISGSSTFGCTSPAGSVADVTITVSPSQSITLVSVSNASICPGNSSVITLSGAGSYNLMPGNMTGSSFTVSPAASTTYTITGTLASGCLSSPANVVNPTITVFSTPTISVIYNSAIACFGGNTLVTATATGGTSPYSYTWQNSTVTTNSVSYTAGTYTMSAADANSCASATQTLVLTQPATGISVTEMDKTPACVSENNGTVGITVSGGTALYTVTWSNGATGNSISNAAAGTLSAIITDANGCTEQYVTIIESKDCSEPLFIPQIFTPNGDGKNDQFIVKGITNYPNATLHVFNRWGSLIYSKKNYQNEWDGKANVGDAIGNGLLPSGTYFVILDFGDAKTDTYTGYVQLTY